MSEDVTAALSRFRDLMVISNSTALSFQSPDRTAPEIGRELGVRYVLRGSVRRSAEDVRLTAQLVEVATDRNVWSQKLDRGWTDVFALQDELTSKIVASIAPEIEADAIARTIRSPDISLSTWELIAQAKWLANMYRREESARAEALFQAAIA